MPTTRDYDDGCLTALSQSDITGDATTWSWVSFTRESICPAVFSVAEHTAPGPRWVAAKCRACGFRETCWEAHG